ncbi:MAG: acylphosphatase [Pyrobaculum sp.]|uniref:acylphosphatase n=1 Tax=unclassified Pyrobaculum TaxID=2643434 RepID=UPI0021D8F657|nr:acylphosphatase [Pyrobaculum sp. 3827-6]MCU7788039.1 acylphosphatase [Pyrobaculum sp. 3827-6]
MKRVVVVARGELDLPGVPILKILKGEALRNNVTGEARLVGDTLYAVLEGADESVDRLVKFLPAASPAIKIREIEIREERYRGEYNGFKITSP